MRDYENEVRLLQTDRNLSQDASGDLSGNDEDETRDGCPGLMPGFSNQKTRIAALGRGVNPGVWAERDSRMRSGAEMLL